MTAPAALTVHVDENVAYQEMEGFGASLTDSSAWALYTQLDEAKRAETLRKLFDPAEGAGFSYIRVPMGASDFALRAYSYNDLPPGETDPTLAKFSIEHDKAYILPLLREALAINPNIRIMGSPWSAPGWMKDTGSLVKGKLKPEYYPVYAQYFVKFIEAYRAEGVPVDAVTLQNEPHYEPSDYPGMRMEPADQAAFAKALGRAFEAAGIDTKIIVWDHNWDEPEYPIEVLNDPEAKAYIDGSAFHGYAGTVENQAFVHDAHPDRGIYFTESSGGEFAPDFGANIVWDVQNLIIGSTRYWAKTVLKWNLALDETHGPTIGGCRDCRGVVTVDKNTKEVTYNEEYYAFGHAAKFVAPGARRIASNTFGSGSIETVAFKNPDGSKALIALNSSSAPKSFKTRWGDRSFLYTLPAGAVATFKWEGAQEGATRMSPFSRIEAEDYDASSGVTSGLAIDSGGGNYIAASSGTGGHVAFRNVEFGSGAASVAVRAAAAGDAALELRHDRPDGPLAATVVIPGTGGPQAWATSTAPVVQASGVRDVYAVWRGDANVNWLQFAKTHYEDALNYLDYNGGFEEGSLDGWQGWNPEGQSAAHKADADGPRGGDYKLTHWLGEPYMQTTYRSVKVPNGTYRASVWARKGSGNDVRLEAKRYGGPDLQASAGTGAIGGWTELAIDGIRVTTGELEIGVFSNSPAGEWAAFDDFAVRRATTTAPAAPTGTNAPVAPQRLEAAVENGFNVRLQWEPSPGADGYMIYRSTVPLDMTQPEDGRYPAFAEAGAVSAAQTAFVDAGLNGETTYHYVVTAYNASGESGLSAAASAATAAGRDGAPPAAPEAFRAEAGEQSAKLRWSPNTERDFASYRIYMNGVPLASVAPVTATSYTAEGLAPGKPHAFHIRAVDRHGNESAPSETATVVPTPPGTPVPFANLDFERGTFEGWSEWHPEGQPVANFVDNDNPRGAFKLTHWAPVDYRQTTYRTLRLPNGVYKVQVWARTGGGQKTFQLEAKNYGGPALTRDLRRAEGGTWTPFAIEGIRVTNGQLEIGVYSDALAGNWAAIDDFEIYSYGPLPDTTAPAIEWLEPADGAVYKSADTIAVRFALTDDESGVDPSKTIATLDGAPLGSGATAQLYKLPLGAHTLQVTAADLAGNVSTSEIRFTVTTDTASLASLVTRFAEEGKIRSRGVASSLLKKLEAGGGGNGARGRIRAFQHEVEAQRGKLIDAEAADVLMRDARQIQDQLG